MGSKRLLKTIALAVSTIIVGACKPVNIPSSTSSSTSESSSVSTPSSSASSADSSETPDSSVSSSPVTQPSSSTVITPTQSFKKMISKLLNKSLKLNSLNLGVDVGGKNLKVSSDDMTVLFHSSDELGLSGSLKLDYGDISEAFTVYLNQNRLVVGYGDSFYSYRISSINDLLSVLSEFDSSIPSSLPDLSSIDSVMSILKSTYSIISDSLFSNGVVSVENIEGGYKLSLDLSSMGKILSSVGLNIDTEGWGTIVFEVSYSGDLKQLTTPGGLNLTAIQKSVAQMNGAKAESAGAVSASDTLLNISATAADGPYTDSFPKDTYNGAMDLAEVNQLAHSAAYLKDSKALQGDFSLTYNRTDGTKMVNTGTIRGDLKDVTSKDTLNLAKAEIALKPGDMVDSAVSAIYSDETVYLDSSVIKGRFTEKTIDNLSEIFKQLNTSGAKVASQGLAGVGDVVSSDLVSDLMSGDISVYYGMLKKGLKYFNTTANSISIGYDPSSYVSFPVSEPIDLSLTFGSSADMPLTEVSISNIPMSDGSSFDFTIQTAPLADKIVVNPDEYPEMDGVSTVANSLFDLYQDRQVSGSYSLDIQGLKNFGDGGLSLNGNIAADLTDLENPDIHLTAQTKINGFDHTIDAYYLDNSVYASYDNVFKNSITKVQAQKVFDIISQRLGADQATTYAVTSGTQDIVDKLKGLVVDEGGKITLSKLAEFVKVTRVDDGYVFDIDPSKVGISAGLIKLKASVADEKLTSISVVDFKYQDLSLSMSFNLDTYVPFSLTDEQKAGYPDVGDIPSLVNGAFNLAQSDTKKYAVDIAATLTDASYTGTVTGKVQFDLKNGIYSGQIKADPDQYKYDYDLKFSYGDPASKDDQGDNLYVMYNDSLGLKMHTTNLSSIIDRIGQIGPDNILGKLLGVASTAGTVTQRAGQSGTDYSKYLNDYIKSITFDGGAMTVIIDPSIFGLNGVDPVSVKVEYADGSIKSASIDNLNVLGKTASVKLTLADYDDSQVSAGIDYTKKFIDGDNADPFLAMLINTTDSSSLVLSGKFNLQPSFVGFDVVKLTADIKFEMYLTPKESDPSTYGITFRISLTSHGWVTSYDILENGDCVIVRNKTGADRASAVVMKVTSQEFTNHIGFYLFGLGLSMYDTYEFAYQIAFNQVLKATDSSVNSGKSASRETDTAAKEDQGGIGGSYIKPEAIIKDATYDAANGKFNLNVDLSSLKIGSGISLTNSLDISVYGENDKLTRIQTSNDKVLSFSSAGSASMDLDISNVTTGKETVADYQSDLQYYADVRKAHPEVAEYTEMTGFKALFVIGKLYVSATDWSVTVVQVSFKSNPYNLHMLP